MGVVLLIITAAMAYGAVGLLLVWVLGERRTDLHLQLIKNCPGSEFPIGGVQRPDVMPRKVEEAVNAFRSGCPCSRVLLATYGPVLGLTRGEAIDVGLRFARDMNIVETCGAVTGACTILALRYPGSDTATPRGRARARAAISEFSNQFKARHASTLCRQLLRGNGRGGQDLASMEPEGDVRLMVCPGLVRDAAEILEAMLKSKHLEGQALVTKLAA